MGRLSVVRRSSGPGVAAIQASLPQLAVESPLSINSDTPNVQEIQARNVWGLDELIVGATVGNTNAETSLLSGSPPFQYATNQLKIGDMVRWRAWGTWTNNTGSGQSSTVRFKADGTSMGQVIIPTTISASATARTWRTDAIYRIIDSTGSKLNGTYTLTLAATGATTDDFSRTTRVATGAFDVTQPLDIDLTVQHGVTDANLTMTCDAMALEHLSVPDA